MKVNSKGYKVVSESLPTVGKISGPRICEYRSIHGTWTQITSSRGQEHNHTSAFARFPVHIVMLRVVHVT